MNWIFCGCEQANMFRGWKWCIWSFRKMKQRVVMGLMENRCLHFQKLYAHTFGRMLHLAIEKIIGTIGRFVEYWYWKKWCNKSKKRGSSLRCGGVLDWRQVFSIGLPMAWKFCNIGVENIVYLLLYRSWEWWKLINAKKPTIELILEVRLTYQLCEVWSKVSSEILRVQWLISLSKFCKTGKNIVWNDTVLGRCDIQQAWATEEWWMWEMAGMLFFLQFVVNESVSNFDVLQ